MTHHDISYAHLDSTVEPDAWHLLSPRHAEALADAKNWFGDERFGRLEAIYHFHAQHGTAPCASTFRLQMAFAGVQGVPVAALWKSFFPYFPFSPRPGQEENF